MEFLKVEIQQELIVGLDANLRIQNNPYQGWLKQFI